MEKFIFLDVDGVLNNSKHTKKLHNRYNISFIAHEMPFDPKCLKRFSKLVHATGAKIVLTSSWRKDLKCETVLKARLKEYGIKIYDMLPINTHSSERGATIKQWLLDNTEVDKETIYADNVPYTTKITYNVEFIILDDYSYDLYDNFDSNRIIMVNPNKGLTNIDMFKGIYKLNSEGD